MHYSAGVAGPASFGAAQALPHDGPLWLAARLLLDGAGGLFGLYLLAGLGLAVAGRVMMDGGADGRPRIALPAGGAAMTARAATPRGCSAQRLSARWFCAPCSSGREPGRRVARPCVPWWSVPVFRVDVSALKYMQSKGGTIIEHGYTHQYSNVANPYDGVTGDDAEFFRAQCATTQTPPYNFDAAVPEHRLGDMDRPLPGRLVHARPPARVTAGSARCSRWRA